MKNLHVAMIYEENRHSNFSKIENWAFDDFGVRIAPTPKCSAHEAYQSGIRIRTDYTDSEKFSTRLMTEGEIGCAFAHYSAIKNFFKNSESGSYLLLFESDAKIENQEGITKAVQKSIDLRLDFCKFGWQDLEESKDIVILDLDDDFIRYRKTWLCHAYMLSYEFAKFLIEYIEERCGLYTYDDLINDAISQTHSFFQLAHWRNSELVIQDPSYNSQTKAKPRETKSEVYGSFSVVSDLKHQGYLRLQDSLQNYNWEYENTILCHWHGHDMSESPGGFQKIIEMWNKLNELEIDDDSIIIHLDGYDTLVTCSPQTLIETWKANFDWEDRVAFGAEEVLWPPPENEDDPRNFGAPYLNSGCYIGLWKNLKIVFQEILSKYPDWRYNPRIFDRDDQEEIAKYAAKNPIIELDVSRCLFFNLNDLHENENLSLLFDPYTNDRRFVYQIDGDIPVRPCVLHGNGKSDEFLPTLLNWDLSASKGIFVSATQPQVDMLRIFPNNK